MIQWPKVWRCQSSIYYFWFPPLVSSNFWPLYHVSFYLLLLITSLISSYFWPLYHLSYLLLLITPLVSSNFWPLYCLSFFDFPLLITSLVTDLRIKFKVVLVYFFWASSWCLMPNEHHYSYIMTRTRYITVISWQEQVTLQLYHDKNKLHYCYIMTRTSYITARS
jgi:hypothetical protein